MLYNERLKKLKSQEGEFMQYGNQDKVKPGQQQPVKKDADFKNRPNINQQGEKSQPPGEPFDAQQPVEAGFSKERPYSEEEHRKLERPTSSIDAQMNKNTQPSKNESTQAAKAPQRQGGALRQREDLNDQDPITGVDKSLGTDTQWSGQKQDPKPGPTQPQVGQQQGQAQSQKGANATSGQVGKSQQQSGVRK